MIDLLMLEPYVCYYMSPIDLRGDSRQKYQMYKINFSVIISVDFQNNCYKFKCLRAILTISEIIAKIEFIDFFTDETKISDFYVWLILMTSHYYNNKSMNEVFD